ncbi:Uncharacterised protein [Arcanobacterium haemolyticum]|uniref:Uncharacterized protein n=1 Tax=Arcanobacterium haemolyticum (strain ATCC 9345 / DSM 20595 / CCM 5947 / CCUG 17215 / LMG 16163 / NBRC 15585 / NCTC 8452 / 11018) TaxID=644284 RepID=D7BLT4_ARCHD|nr:hypothetical protein Arch_0120 [Arcanobacterium haemolyticum DSM 20595]SQH27070.1 Uncharacterised protein [Arcanobacterium haemolyticum]
MLLALPKPPKTKTGISEGLEGLAGLNKLLAGARSARSGTAVFYMALLSCVPLIWDFHGVGLGRQGSGLVEDWAARA